MMLGDLIGQLDKHGVGAGVLATLDPEISASINERARSLSMSSDDFVAGAVREFVDHADDSQWAQLLTHMKTADDAGLKAVQVILCWVASGPESQ